MRLGRDFYLSPATELAPRLLGKFLCRRIENEVIKAEIVQTECYYGADDTACHAHMGRTSRTEPMFASGGITYIYLCYGIHSLLNIVTGEEGHPQAVLIRGIKGAIGPGRVTKKLLLNLAHNKLDLTTSDELWIENAPDAAYTTAPRVGIDYAQKSDREKHWRFILSE